ncbi:hypothetical protein V9K67_15185 [Paraflavisolibacter sp. H34]|uniref:hypothetical protein n=1 Tax=Huijunlia imazamoxiresistens TaxID=3127457 RepID=UPI003017DF8B
MDERNHHLEAIDDIKKLMHQSSRFISLSGWSGVAAGLCALVGAAYTGGRIECWKRGDCAFGTIPPGSESETLQYTLVLIALLTFFLAFTSAFFFTYARSRKIGLPLWGHTSRRVLVAVAVPMIAGGLLIWRMMDFGFFGLVAPACLLFYGLALVNASKFTLPEIRYLGYCQLVLGIINLWVIGYGLYFWAMGFGVLHIVYGMVMWNKYERNQEGGA